MLSQPKNRVQAIKSKFENLGNDNIVTNIDNITKNNHSKLAKLTSGINKTVLFDKENIINNDYKEKASDSDSSSDSWSAKPNSSYLYSKGDVKRSLSDTKKSLIRQTSDPGKKLHRSHAFRCDRSKIVSPKRVGSCNGRSETSDFGLKMGEKKLSKDRLKRLGNLLEDQMRKENFVATNETIVGQVLEVNDDNIPLNSIPDSQVPKHILDQYAKVVKHKKNEERQDAMTDSGVSSETENLEDDKSNRIKKLMNQFEKSDSIEESSSNLDSMNELCVSSETMRLERKNPHLTLTDTLKKALKQPLPPGPPPKKPPRVFLQATIQESPEKHKKDAKKMLEKLEQVLQKRESQKNDPDIVESNKSNTNSMITKKPKEIHYLCTEILDITHKTLLPNTTTNCFKSLNCAITNNSTLSLPYTRLSSHRDSLCSCSNYGSNPEKVLTTFMSQKCGKCQSNDQKHDQFKCHLKCQCKTENSRFFVDEHIYDEPFNEVATIGRKTDRTKYGSLNNSKSLEDLRISENVEDQKIYDIPCDISRPETPENQEQKDTGAVIEPATTNKQIEPKVTINSDFERLRRNFENGFLNKENVAVEKNKEKVASDKNSVKYAKIPNSDDNIDVTIRLKKNSDKEKDANDKNSNKNGKISKSDGNTDIHTRISLLEEKVANDKKSIKINSGKSPNNDCNSDISTRISLIEDLSTKNVKEISRRSFEKPPMRPKPIFIKNRTRSIENILEESRNEKKGRKFSTEGRKYRRERDANMGRMCLAKKDSTQLDVDKENLNRLMNEIYETVAAVSMADNKPGSFPTDHSDGSTSEDSVKLTRSLTEKRKNYVRRVSSRVAYLDPKNLKNTRFRHQTSVCSYKSEILDNPYSTFRSWKSFRTSQNNLANKMERRTSTDSKFNLTDSTGNIMSLKNEFDSSETIDNISIDDKTGCVGIELPFEPRERGLFNVCLLVGLNYMTGQAYVKSVFPNQVQVPQHIENLIFPETLSSGDKSEIVADGKAAQCYSLVLTDERGERSYGYCRRVLPEGATTCLPLCYCLIGKYRAPGFYYKVLQEIESHHGSSEVEIHSILQQLFETDFPNPGEEITISYTKTDFDRNKSNSANFDRKSATFADKSKTMPDLRRSLGHDDSPKNGLSKDAFSAREGLSVKENGLSTKSDLNSEVNCESAKLPDYYDLENNNGPKKVFLCLDGPRMKTLKRPIEPRIDEDNLSILLDSLGAGLTIKVFGSLLLERKVLIMSEQLSLVSSCLEALQSSLYPLVWQQPLISVIPSEIQREVFEAPLPMLAGALSQGSKFDSSSALQEGMLVDLSHPTKVLFYQGDESTILPTNSYKSLKTALQMETKKDREDSKMRNVMISEAFLRFFVDILGDFWKYFSIGELKEGQLGKGDVVFDKDAFIRNAPSKQNQYFLEWFTETAMFNHFIQNMSITYRPSLTSEYQRQNSDVTTSTANDSQRTSISECQRQNSTTESTSSTSSTSTLTSLVDTPLPDFYEIFNERIHSRTKAETQKYDKSNYKNAMNKRMRLLKTKLRELVT